MGITALLELHIREDRLADATEIIATTLKDTRAFDGNLGLEVLVDVQDPAHITVVEHWQSLAHDDAYRAWRATPEGASQLGEIVDRAPFLSRYETQSEH